MKRGITLPDEAGNYMFRMQIYSRLLSYEVNPNIMPEDYQSWKCRIINVSLLKHKTELLKKSGIMLYLTKC